MAPEWTISEVTPFFAEVLAVDEALDKTLDDAVALKVRTTEELSLELEILVEGLTELFDITNNLTELELRKLAEERELLET